MSATLSREDVQAVAALAHLELTEEEIAVFAAQLGGILEYVRQIAPLDTSGVPPTAHVLSGAPVERPDDPRPCLDPAEALANAPDAEAGLFRVPRVIG